MAFEVLRVRSVARVVASFTKPELRAYTAAVDALRGEGCAAGGKRLLALDGSDYPLCQRSLYGSWRMTLAFRDDTSIVIIAITRHTRRESPNRVIAEIFPGLSAVGRRRSDQPPCCEDPADPPQLSPELREILNDIFGV